MVLAPGPLGVGLTQPGDTMYHSGSEEASSGLSIPSVLQGRRPTAGRLPQTDAVMPSWAGLPTFTDDNPGSLPCPEAPGNVGNEPGLSSVNVAPGVAAFIAT